MRFSRKIVPDTKPKQNFVTKKRLREDEINFDKLRSYRLDRVKKELEKRNIDPNIIEILNQLFNNCEMARYTPITNVEMESDYKTALDIISKIDKSIN